MGALSLRPGFDERTVGRLMRGLTCRVLCPVRARAGEESRHRTAVMRKLGFVDDSGVVLLKGRAAACIDTTDELLTAAP
ncbi:hypothetical protein MNEG_16703 [Monoraphidium neglectum]|uniref:Uncharacterized protein n=1 Tax=Monoraphidium neglectum TaxID=145388 RepID=A0A0D2IT97_9CHLO|nr:hypothetical protein MNEG_16703 [Monoraphidium neglectum]KIY91262.1 hypothetical protein MNEG_16703 [Monoraphidium neglectum]|eukprot:XP_013890282.1 hypothetical protein MNEG_16703 [Monoraphidium neglectum]